jgi:hypothetical protein
MVARDEPVRRLRDDGNTTLEAGMSPGIGLKIAGERAQRSGDNVSDEILRRLTIKCRVRYHDIAGSDLEWLLQALCLKGLWLEALWLEGLRLEGLRLEAQQKRHQIAEQPNELLNV